MEADTQEPDTLSSSERIVEILSEVSQRQSVISVRLTPEGPLHDFLLSRLEPDEKRLYLDRLKPLGPNEEIDPGQNLDIFINLRGISIRFSVQVEEVLAHQPSTLYVGHFPKQVLYLQRRDIFRVHIPLYDQRHVRLRLFMTDVEIDVRLIDISVKGFGVEAPKTAFDDSWIGSRFDYLDMDLPDLRASLAGSATLINIRPSPKSGFVSAGFSIEDLDPQTERALMRAALYYQREARRTGG